MPAMLFAATTLIDVLIPLVIGIGVQFVPIRANPPKLTADNEDTRSDADNAGSLLCAKVAKEVYEYFRKR